MFFIYPGDIKYDFHCLDLVFSGNGVYHHNCTGIVGACRWKRKHGNYLSIYIYADEANMLLLIFGRSNTMCILYDRQYLFMPCVSIRNIYIWRPKLTTLNRSYRTTGNDRNLEQPTSLAQQELAPTGFVQHGQMISTSGNDCMYHDLKTQ